MRLSKPINLFSALALFGCCAVMAILAAVSNSTLRFQSLPHWLLQLMSLYLVFIFIRTGLHLMFSFLWGANRGTHKSEITIYPMVSIIIPCYQEESVIQDAIRAIQNIDYPNKEIIVVDDGSTDLTFSKVHELKDIRVIFQKNAGKAAALNRGIQEALGEFVLCVDADSYIEPDSIKEGMTHLLRDSRIAAVAGNVKVGNIKGLVASFQKLEYVMALNFLKIAQSFFGAVVVVPGPAGLFRKSKLLEVGGYNTSSFAEDCDLTLRLLMAGHRVVYEPNMVAVTEVPARFSALTKQRYRWSRGVLQAIKLNAQWLRHPLKNTRNFLIMWYMLVESFVIPTFNYLFAITTLILALSTHSHLIVGYYFFQLIILDIVVALYSLVSSGLSMQVLMLALINRFTYGLALEVQRFYSIFDEILSLPMSWGKLERKGLK